MSYCILSFCGGGIRGILSAGYLSKLYFQCQHIVKNADLLAGTSTGADIISLLMFGMDPDMVYEKYKVDAPKTFEFPDYDPSSPGYSVANLLKTQKLLHPHGKTLNHYDKHSVL